ncbi:MAG: PilW family protein [Steroidobacteraceae bacterium]
MIRPRGYGLVELMVALVLGTFIVTAALRAYDAARNARASLDARARLHETARHALDLVAADVRMAGHYGLAGSPIDVDPTLAFPAKCGGAGWVSAVDRAVDGVNNRYLAQPNCGASGGGAMPGTDVLVVRRASAVRIEPQRPTVAVPDRSRVLVVTSRTGGRLFVPAQMGNGIPDGYATADVAGQPPLADTRALLVHAYYVSTGSTGAARTPALRRKLLVSGPDVSDEEVIGGVDDLQVRFGLDDDGDGSVDRYVEPGTQGAARPRSVVVCLRVVSDARDPALVRQSLPPCGDRPASVTTDRRPRLVATRTVALRNGRP